MRFKTTAVASVIPSLFLSILFYGCTESAPRLNPLDPQSPEFDGRSAIEGTVTTIYQPFAPLAGTEVRLWPGPLLRFTDDRGAFRFEALTAGSYRLQFSQPGYAVDSLQLELASRTLSNPVIRLNGLPRIDSVAVMTFLVAQIPPDENLFFLQIKASANDADGESDIKRVSLEIESIGFVDSLERIGNSSEWILTRLAGEIGVDHLEQIAGKPLIVRAEDFPGLVTESAPAYLSRVIDEPPGIVAPANNEVTTSAPLFRWELQPRPYSFAQEIEVFRIDALGITRRLVSFGSIAAQRRSFNFVGRLGDGDYFWTIKLIDSFGNTSRSPEAGFRVQ